MNYLIIVSRLNPLVMFRSLGPPYNLAQMRLDLVEGPARERVVIQYNPVGIAVVHVKDLDTDGHFRWEPWARERRSVAEFRYIFGCEEVIDDYAGAGGEVRKADGGKVDVKGRAGRAVSRLLEEAGGLAFVR